MPSCFAASIVSVTSELSKNGLAEIELPAKADVHEKAKIIKDVMKAVMNFNFLILHL